MLTTYADAIEKAGRLGRPFEFIVKVRPDRARPLEGRGVGGDALGAARERGSRRVADIMRSPDMLSAQAFAPLIGASHDTVNQKRRSGETLALGGATRGLAYPRWQITDGGRLLPGLAELMRELSGGSWTVYRFLHRDHPELERGERFGSAQAGSRRRGH